jgi:hypothetical protein
VRRSRKIIDGSQRKLPDDEAFKLVVEIRHSELLHKFPLLRYEKSRSSVWRVNRAFTRRSE